MAAISDVSEADMAAFIKVMEEAGMDAAAVDAIIRRPTGVIAHEVSRFMLRVRGHSTHEEASVARAQGPMANWPGVTG